MTNFLYEFLQACTFRPDMSKSQREPLTPRNQAKPRLKSILKTPTSQNQDDGFYQGTLQPQISDATTESQFDFDVSPVQKKKTPSSQCMVF